MKSIHTLIPDIYELLEGKHAIDSREIADEMAREAARRLQLVRSNRAELRLSGLGPECPKALWHRVHTPELAEPLPPWAVFKFQYGHLIEALAIVLAKAAGHTVEGEQDELVVDGIVGHRDCVVDGCLLDVKSCSSRMFQKFKTGLISKEDSFGYLDQLDGYLVGSRNDPLVRNKHSAYDFVIDKQFGHMYLYEHHCREDHIRERIKDYKRIVALPKSPDCRCRTEPYGKSGNIKLDTKASYSAYKYCCFPRLRAFLYSDGPVYMTKVVRTPDVPEIDRYGNLLYVP